MSVDVPEIGHLKLLIAVADYGSLGGAARAMTIAQPNASRTLSRLERQLGLSLVERSTTGSTLTDDGHKVVAWARHVVDTAECLVAGAHSLRQETQQYLSVSASMTVAEYLVPHWLAQFRKSSPDVQVNIAVHNSRDVFEQVTSGAGYVGFVETPHVPEGLRMLEVGTDRLVVVVSPAHPWARRENPVTRRDLASTPLVLREPGSGTRHALELHLSGTPMVAPALEFSSNAAVRIAAETGVAPAVLSDLAVRSAVDAGRLVEVPVMGSEMTRTFHAVWRSHLPKPATDLLRISRTAGAKVLVSD